MVRGGRFGHPADVGRVTVPGGATECRHATRVFPPVGIGHSGADLPSWMSRPRASTSLPEGARRPVSSRHRLPLVEERERHVGKGFPRIPKVTSLGWTVTVPPVAGRNIPVSADTADTDSGAFPRTGRRSKTPARRGLRENNLSARDGLPGRAPLPAPTRIVPQGGPHKASRPTVGVRMCRSGRPSLTCGSSA